MVSHRSLRDLLTAHKLVKVKVNGMIQPQDLAAAAEQLAAGSGGQLLQLKGSSMLFAVGGNGSSDEELLEVRECSARRGMRHEQHRWVLSKPIS
jgi:RNA-binding protein YhbY